MIGVHMVYGWTGRVLYVDLTQGTYRIEELDSTILRAYIGGAGIALRILLDILKPLTDPFSPENPLIIGAGPLVGTGVPACNKIQMVTKFTLPADPSRQKYYIGIASGGTRRFGDRMKKAGYDQLVFTGRAEKPVYVHIENDAVEIRKAEDLWGSRNVYETTEELMKRHSGGGVIAIGRGGENRVSFSLPFVDGAGTIGRGGPGGGVPRIQDRL